METVKVERLTKYGFQADGVYYNWSKRLPESQKTSVVPGKVFEADIFTSKKGSKYINSLNEVKVFNPVMISEAKSEKLSNNSDKPMTREDWDSKDRRISRQGMLQACIQAVAPLVALENIFDEAVKLANRGLNYVNQKND